MQFRHFAWAPALLTLVAAPAFAHVGHTETSGFAAGIGHPIFGPDHLLAMIAVALWAALISPRQFWIAPAGFLTGMILGGLTGLAGGELPGMEIAIAGSVLALGLLTLFKTPLPALAGAALALAFGAVHGMAHGTEIPSGAGAFSYVAGFLIATAALHLTGTLAGLALRQRFSLIARSCGAAIAATGLWMSFGAIAG